MRQRPSKFTPLLWLLVCAAPVARADVELHGKVVAVADGDTVTLLDAERVQHRIRLSGIDAPELGQPFGQRSRQHLADLVFAQSAIASCPKQDRYGRQVCKLTIDDRDVNLLQLSTGLAWHYRQYEREQPPKERAAYRDAEEHARSSGAGLWRDADPTPPWQWRRTRRERD